MKDELFNEYFGKISQRVDWLVTTCINAMVSPVARESAREHLNTTIKHILTEVYEVGYTMGEKKATYDYDQKYRVNKFKLEDKLRKDLKKEILDIVLKEYGIKDEKNKKKIVKKVLQDEINVEEEY